MPPAVKVKKYRDEFRRRFCESLLARRVLITEGKTEYDVYSSASRKMQCLHPEKSYSFDLLGIALVNAETDTQVSALGQYYKRLGKTVYAVFDKQEERDSEQIALAVDCAYEANEHGIEDVVLKGIKPSVLLRFALDVVASGEWPPHLSNQTPYEGMKDDELYTTMKLYFKNKKGEGALAELVQFCEEDEMPLFIKDTIISISETVYPISLPNDINEE